MDQRSLYDNGANFSYEQSVKQHVTKVSSSCFYHLRRLKQTRRLVGKEATAQLVSEFILSRLDYCNAVLAARAAASYYTTITTSTERGSSSSAQPSSA